MTLENIKGLGISIHPESKRLVSINILQSAIDHLVEKFKPVDIQDLAGDGNHYSATVVSSQFSGKSKIEQHKMVYNSLKGKMGNELHALAIKTKEQ